MFGNAETTEENNCALKAIDLIKNGEDLSF